MNERPAQYSHPLAVIFLTIFKRRKLQSTLCKTKKIRTSNSKVSDLLNESSIKKGTAHALCFPSG